MRAIPLLVLTSVIPGMALGYQDAGSCAKVVPGLRTPTSGGEFELQVQIINHCERMVTAFCSHSRPVAVVVG